MPVTRLAHQILLSAALISSDVVNGKATVDTASNAKISYSVLEDYDKDQCILPQGWNSIQNLHPEFVVFGELHGTRQAPKFVGDIVCALAVSGQKILLGIEFDASLDSKFQAAWNESHDQFPERLRQEGWAGRRDGVASEAMFDLLVRLHELKSKGAAISIAAFNGTKDKDQIAKFSTLKGQNPHEASQAENIMLAARSDSYNLTIVLVGNIHAMKQPVERPQATFEPMAMRLARSNVVVTLDMETAGGSAWNCKLKNGFVPGNPITDDAITCGNDDVKPHAGAEISSKAVRLNAGSQSSKSYDGVFSVGRVTGSPPAVSTP